MNGLNFTNVLESPDLSENNENAEYSEKSENDESEQESDLSENTENEEYSNLSENDESEEDSDLSENNDHVTENIIGRKICYLRFSSFDHYTKEYTRLTEYFTTKYTDHDLLYEIGDADDVLCRDKFEEIVIDMGKSMILSLVVPYHNTLCDEQNLPGILLMLRLLCNIDLKVEFPEIEGE